MRNLTLLALSALAIVACKPKDDDTPDTNDTNTTVTYSHTLADATASFTADVGGTTICDWSWSLTGTEYKQPLDCPGCDYAFLIDATVASGAADQSPPCPTNTPFPYSFPSYDLSNGDTLQSGFAEISDGSFYWYFVGYGGGIDVDVTDGFMTFMKYADYMLYAQFFSGTVSYGGNEYPYGDNFTNNDGAISWDALTEAQAGTYDTRIFCDDVDLYEEDDTDYDYTATPAGTPPANPLTTPDETISGVISNCASSTVDSFTVTVAAGATLEVAVDVTDGTKMFDSLVWVNEPGGCTAAQADDQFECTAGPGVNVGTSSTLTFASCSYLKLEDAAAGTYEIFVRSTNFGNTCKDTATPKTAPYTLQVKGATGLTAAKDNYYPEIELSFTGSGTVTRTQD